MSRFRNVHTDVVFSVDDSKDHRYAGDGFEKLTVDTPARKTPAKKTADK